MPRSSGRRGVLVHHRPNQAVTGRSPPSASSVDAGALPRGGRRPRHRALISDAQVAEIAYTAFADTRSDHRQTHRPQGPRRQHPGPLFPVWRYHPFFTNTTEPTTDADITHRQHAICETVWSDLIDGPWAHQPSGRFPANTAWCVLAAITHNLLRAAGTLTGTSYAVARGATLRRQLINIPARIARPQRHRTTPTRALAPRRRLAHLLDRRVHHVTAALTPRTRRNTTPVNNADQQETEHTGHGPADQPHLHQQDHQSAPPGPWSTDRG